MSTRPFEAEPTRKVTGRLTRALRQSNFAERVAQDFSGKVGPDDVKIEIQQPDGSTLLFRADGTQVLLPSSDVKKNSI